MRRFRTLAAVLSLSVVAWGAAAERPSGTLAESSNKAQAVGLYTLPAPFLRPFQYIGMTVAKAEAAVGKQANQAGKIIVATERAELFLEPEGNFISFASVTLKQTAPCSQSRAFDPEPALGALSIGMLELDPVGHQTHAHVYYDHRHKLKVTVICDYDGAPLSVNFSSKYYGM